MRLGKFSLWISAAEFPPRDNKPEFSLWTSPVSHCLLFWLCFCRSVHRFTLPILVALFLTRWLVACTDRELGSHDSHHVREGSSPNEDYVAFLVRKLVDWYHDGPAREGRTPPAGNDGFDDEAVEVGEGVQIMLVALCGVSSLNHRNSISIPRGQSSV